MADFHEEAKIRDYLASHIEALPSLIGNLAESRQRLLAIEEEFEHIAPVRGGPSPLDLLRVIVARRTSRELRSLHDLELIGKEFQLLSTGVAGYQPSADILARCTETSRLFLLEVKQLVGTERQAVTELSAYTHGLHHRLWNLAPSDYVWMPISNHWRTTVRAAFANEIVLGRRPVLPLRYDVEKSADGSVTKVALDLLDLEPDGLDDPLAFAQFAYSCFSVLTFEMAKEPSDPRTLVEFASATAARHGFSGCAFYGQSLAGDHFPYPHVVALVVHNPFLAALKRRQLELIAEPSERRRAVKLALDELHDLDFKTMEDREVRWPPEPYVGRGGEISVRDLAAGSANRVGVLHEELRARIAMFCEFESHGCSLDGLLRQDIPVLWEHVSYFGLLQEAVCERLRWEVSHASDGDGPVIGDYGGDAVAALGSFPFFREFMSLMNCEHESQTFHDFCGDDDDAGQDEE